MRLILASGSPRRAELIKKVVSGFKAVTVEIIPSNIEEVPKTYESSENYAVRIAFEKAQAVYSHVAARGAAEEILVLGCDTAVALNGNIYGKPADKKEAESMFRQLCGNTHEVITGVCLFNKYKKITKFEKSFVTFGAFSPEMVYTYIESGAPFDKAGGYGIQDGAIRPLITKVEGDLSNIVGLPVKLVRKILVESFHPWH